jgi:hypothetical protein
MDQLNCADLLFGKSGRRPEVISLDVLAFIALALRRFARLVYHASQIDPLSAAFLVDFDRARQQGVNFGLC